MNNYLIQKIAELIVVIALFIFINAAFKQCTDYKYKMAVIEKTALGFKHVGELDETPKK